MFNGFLANLTPETFFNGIRTALDSAQIFSELETTYYTDALNAAEEIGTSDNATEETQGQALQLIGDMYNSQYNYKQEKLNLKEKHRQDFRNHPWKDWICYGLAGTDLKNWWLNRAR